MRETASCSNEVRVALTIYSRSIIVPYKHLPQVGFENGPKHLSLLNLKHGDLGHSATTAGLKKIVKKICFYKFAPGGV